MIQHLVLCNWNDFTTAVGYFSIFQGANERLYPLRSCSSEQRGKIEKEPQPFGLR